MSKRLKYEDIEAYVPKNTGSIRVNHNTLHCSGSSKSLKIERKEDGSIVANCYRCGKYYLNAKTDERLRSLSSGHTTGREISSAVHARGRARDASGVLPSDRTPDLKRWPEQQRHWIKRSGVTCDELSANGICYSPSVAGVVLPIHSMGTYQGYQVRSDYPNPKYYTSHDDRADSLWGFIASPSVDSTLVVVEDILSGIRVARVSDALVLFGNDIKTSAVGWLIENKYDKIMVWLDNDNGQVIRQAQKIKRRLDFLSHVSIIRHPTDPKNMSDADIQEAIHDTT